MDLVSYDIGEGQLTIDGANDGCQIGKQLSDGRDELVVFRIYPRLALRPALFFGPARSQIEPNDQGRCSFRQG